MLDWITLCCYKTCCIDVANHLCTNWWHVVLHLSSTADAGDCKSFLLNKAVLDSQALKSMLLSSALLIWYLLAPGCCLSSTLDCWSRCQSHLFHELPQPVMLTASSLSPMLISSVLMPFPVLVDLSQVQSLLSPANLPRFLLLQFRLFTLKGALNDHSNPFVQLMFYNKLLIPSLNDTSTHCCWFCSLSVRTKALLASTWICWLIHPALKTLTVLLATHSTSWLVLTMKPKQHKSVCSLLLPDVAQRNDTPCGTWQLQVLWAAVICPSMAGVGDLPKPRELASRRCSTLLVRLLYSSTVVTSHNIIWPCYSQLRWMSPDRDCWWHPMFPLCSHMLALRCKIHTSNCVSKI